MCTCIRAHVCTPPKCTYTYAHVRAQYFLLRKYRYHFSKRALPRITVSLDMANYWQIIKHLQQRQQRAKASLPAGVTTLNQRWTKVDSALWHRVKVHTPFACWQRTNHNLDIWISPSKQIGIKYLQSAHRHNIYTYLHLFMLNLRNLITVLQKKQGVKANLKSYLQQIHNGESTLNQRWFNVIESKFIQRRFNAVGLLDMHLVRYKHSYFRYLNKLYQLYQMITVRS